MTATEITNLALGKLGANTIADLDDEPFLRPNYLQARGEILRAHDWNFATRRKTLPVSSGTTAPFEVAIPADNLRALEILSNGCPLEDHDYRIEGQNIRSNASLLTLVYISDQVSDTTFPPDFVEALATLLASKFAGTVLKNPEKVAQYEASYRQDKLPAAKHNDTTDSPGSLYRHHAPPYATSPAILSRRPGGLGTGSLPRDRGIIEPATAEDLDGAFEGEL